MNRFDRLRRFVASEIVDLGIPDGALSPEDMRRTRIISITSLCMCLFAGVPSIVHFVRLEMTSLTTLLVAAISAALANLLLLRARRRPRLAAHVSMVILGSLLLASNIITGGFYDPNFAWLYVLPLAAAALIDMRAATIWTVALIGITIAFWLLPGFGIELVNYVPEAARESNALFNRITAICAIGVLAVSFVAGQRRAEQKLATANQGLLAETAYVQLLMVAAVAANEAQSFENAIQDSMQRICETMSWVAGQVFLVGEDESIVNSGIIHTQDRKFDILRRRARTHKPKPRTGLVGRSITEGRPQISDALDPTDDPEDLVNIARRCGITSAMAVPIFVNGDVPAVMLFGSPSRIDNEERLREVFALIGVQLGKVAERTALQERVQQTQKMEAVGQLAAGVAHEINNPMSYVRTNLHTLREEWSELRSKLPSEGDERLSDFQELIEESLEGVERTIAIVRDVREFSHNGVVDREEWETTLLGDLLDGGLRVVASQAPAGVRIGSDHDPEAFCRCSANQIRQVFVNLIVNAVQAVGDSGQILLSTGRDGNEVFARIEDDGPGMSEATRERLFDPFFTTKPVGEGTGLGLSVSYEIVRNHGGEILVSSERGRGSCFEVRLPVDPD